MINNFELALQDFKNGSPAIQHSAFRKLIALRMHHKASNDPRFSFGIDRIICVASDAKADDLNRLLCVTTLARVASTIRGIRPKLHQALAEVLESPLPDPNLLDDVEDRTYIGEACAIALPAWTSMYAARCAVWEESGEQARQAFLVALLKSTADLETALDALVEQLHTWVPVTEEPGNTVSKRLRRILAALRAAIADTMPEPGEDPGASLSKVVKVSYSGASTPTNLEALADTAEEVAGVVHEMVRLRFSLATNSSTYSALNPIQSLFPIPYWKKVVQDSKMVKTVASDIEEALLVIARQGVTDSALVSQLGKALGGEAGARDRLKELAKKSGLSPEIKVWLTKGKLEVPRNVRPEVGESRRLSDDALLADLLVDACRFRIKEESDRRQILPEMEILNPAHANELKKLLNYALSLCDATAVIAKRRGLKTRGVPGDEEDYAPLDHEVVGTATGFRRVRIIRPVVEQVSEDGVPYVVRKGLVEPVM